MSVWGPGSFENDDAINWVLELGAYADDSPIINALNSVIEHDSDPLEASDCSVVIAAAEVVAAQMGKPVTNCPEAVKVWIKGRSTPSSTITTKARQVTRMILVDSQLKNVWKGTHDFEAWQASVEDLLSRLSFH